MLFRPMQQGKIPAAGKMDQRIIQKFDIRVVGQISKNQMRGLSILHENFARNITNSLGAYLRVGFEVNLVSFEQLNFPESLSRLPDMTYLSSIRIHPFEVLALMQMDLSAAFPVMDIVRRDAYDEFLRQVVGQISTSLRVPAWVEVEIQPCGTDLPVWPTVHRTESDPAIILNK